MISLSCLILALCGAGTASAEIPFLHYPPSLTSYSIFYTRPDPAAPARGLHLGRIYMTSSFTLTITHTVYCILHLHCAWPASPRLPLSFRLACLILTSPRLLCTSALLILHLRPSLSISPPPGLALLIFPSRRSAGLALFHSLPTSLFVIVVLSLHVRHCCLHSFYYY